MAGTDIDLLIGMVRDLGGKLDDAISKQNEQHTEVMTEVSSLTTQMTSLIGNGQPGRITKIEEKVESINSFRWKWVGVATAWSFIISVAGIVFGYFTHKH